MCVASYHCDPLEVMELFDSHPEEVNQAVMTSDSLQCEIAEQLDSGEPVDG